MAGASIGQAWIDIRARMDSLNNDVNRAAGQVQSRLGGATRAMGALGATAASAKIAGVLNNAATAASDLGEAQNATNVAFASGAPIIDRFAKNALKEVGLAEVTVRNLAVAFGAMFNSAGIQSDKAAQMTEGLIKRAVDVGSVFNASGKEVTEAFGAAIRGEAEPARRFGVFLNAAAIEAEALQMGLVKATVPIHGLKDAQLAAEAATKAHAVAVRDFGASSTQATDAGAKMEAAQKKVADTMKGSVPPLTDAQKMQAAYSITMRQTEQTAGDYTKTADSKANADRRAKEATLEASAALGENLAPIMAEISKVVASVMGAFEKMPGPVKTATAVLLALGVVAGPIGSLVTLLGMLGPSAAAAGAGAGAGGAGAGAGAPGFFAFAAGVWAAMVPLLPIIALIAAVIAIGVLLYKNWDSIKEGAKVVWGWISGFLGGIFTKIKENWMLMLGPMGLIIKYWDEIKEAAGKAWGWIWDKISGFVDFVSGVPQAIAGALGGIWDSLVNGFKAAWNFIARAMNAADFTIPSWVPVVGGKTFGYPDLPMLAAGGSATAPGWSVVGEQGPELRYMPKGASIVPLKDAGPAGGGGASISVVVHGSVLTERDLIESVRDGLFAKGYSNGSALGSGVRGRRP